MMKYLGLLAMAVALLGAPAAGQEMLTQTRVTVDNVSIGSGLSEVVAVLGLPADVNARTDLVTGKVWAARWKETSVQFGKSYQQPNALSVRGGHLALENEQGALGLNCGATFNETLTFFERLSSAVTCSTSETDANEKTLYCKLQLLARDGATENAWLTALVVDDAAREFQVQVIKDPIAGLGADGGLVVDGASGVDKDAIRKMFEYYYPEVTQ